MMADAMHDVLPHLAKGIQEAKVGGQRERFTDAYAELMAVAALKALEDAGYRIVKADGPRAFGPIKDD
jgi:hypothetical protein